MPNVLYPGGGNCDDGTSPCVGPNCIGNPISNGNGPVVPSAPCLFGCSGEGNTCTGADCDNGECVGPNCVYTTNGGEWHVYWMCDSSNGFGAQVIVGLPGPSQFGPILLESQTDHYELSSLSGTVAQAKNPPSEIIFNYLGMATGSTLVEVVGVNGGINIQSVWSVLEPYGTDDCDPKPPEQPHIGCQDPTACNYNTDATIHDQTSCLYTSGCTEESALNYNAFAGCDDGTCCYIEGCTDQNAFNFTSEACFDDGSCCYVQGCMDSTMFNYDPLACFPGDCELIESDCTDPLAVNYNPSANTDDGSCTYDESNGGCTVLGANNYDPSQTIANNSLCEWHVPRFCLSDVEQPTGVNPLFPGTSITNDAYLIFTPKTQPSNASALLALANLTTIKDFISSLATPYIVALETILGVTLTVGDSITYSWSPNKTACMKFLGYDIYYGDGSQIIASAISPTPILLGPMASTTSVYFQNPNVSTIYTSEICGDCTNNPSGCTDSAALNYDAFAVIDDNSCQYSGIYGCTDPYATNYDPSATTDDGSCTYCTYGCTDPYATNYDPLATCNDGSCTYEPIVIDTSGCTDPYATNYNPLATIDDGSCLYTPITEQLHMGTPSSCVNGGSSYNITWSNGDPTHNVKITLEVFDVNFLFLSSIVVTASQPNTPPQSISYTLPTTSSLGITGNGYFQFKITSLDDGFSDKSEYFQYCQ